MARMIPSSDTRQIAAQKWNDQATALETKWMLELLAQKECPGDGVLDRMMPGLDGIESRR